MEKEEQMRNDPQQKEWDNTDPLAWQMVSSEHLVKDEWIDFRKEAYRFPDGSTFAPFYSYSRKDYVVIVARDTEGNYLCVRQFRQGIKQVTTEFPAGGMEQSDGAESAAYVRATPEGALKAAKRELREETGYKSDDWRFLLAVPSNATMADNYAYIFLALNCTRASGQKLDDTEFLHVEKHSAREIEAMIENGGFQQAIHVLAWLLHLQKLPECAREDKTE